MASPPLLPDRAVSQLPPPPPLPPRNSSQLPPPPPYSVVDKSRISPASKNQGIPKDAQILRSMDPRASSSQSLAPSESSSDTRRTLLVVYIHGFYGNDQSFHSFPAHVHNYLREALSETHVVHSKLYPRYKTYKAIEIARNNFSAWLEPHESPNTDVILIGHSMGGLLAAEMVLMPNRSTPGQNPFKHRILGTLSLDSPFLGLHPGIVSSGIASLFQAAPASPSEGTTPSSAPDAQSAEVQSVSSATSIDSPLRGPRDPNFDPPFFNDAPFREQPFLTRMLNFSTKHWSEGIFTALGHHVASHLEFGGCLADYRGLMSRYNQIRALEDIDDLQALSGGLADSSHPRVRFLNYYTLAPGRPKPVSAKGSRDISQVDLSADTVPESKVAIGIDKELVDIVLTTADDNQIDDNLRDSISTNPPKASTPARGDHMDDSASASELIGKISIKDVDPDSEMEKPSPSPDLSRFSMQEIEPIPIDEDEQDVEQSLDTTITTNSEQSSPPVEYAGDEKKNLSEQTPISPDPDLPPIPHLPPPPEQPDLSQYTDKDSRKQAEKEFSRLQKAYENAVKDRTKALREREKLLEKRQKKAQKDADKLEKDAKKLKQQSEQDQRRLEKEAEKAIKAEKKRQEKDDAAQAKHLRSASKSVAASATTAAATPKQMPETEPETPPGSKKPKKLRKFCNTPAKRDDGVVADPTWVDVYMDGMDEVTAHCALFLPGPHYDGLVGDVASRIVGWVQNDLSVRAMLEMD
ncbi:hypothetical protein MKX07_000704 [Trichoderma sp. CBMAI-0711]|uniref:DUF676 domain-containing protein n=1 Tax=Trichoderma parareesei TaxID=858221 RepID=A0A2H3A8Z2_TRIPA|nr:hypothetical protein MKX07_000704 [Trichoderma sp. CBMAI-0711]OTA07594.1 hypothetical protein A9Z42_0085190 [Trichoderma parareesei]